MRPHEHGVFEDLAREARIEHLRDNFPAKRRRARLHVALGRLFAFAEAIPLKPTRIFSTCSSSWRRSRNHLQRRGAITTSGAI